MFRKEVSVFISSPYKDLKEDRNKAIQAILTMNQFRAYETNSVKVCNKGRNYDKTKRHCRF